MYFFSVLLNIIHPHILPVHERETPSQLAGLTWNEHWLTALSPPEHVAVYPGSPGLSPNLEFIFSFLAVPHMSSLQTRSASFLPQLLWQTFPHWPSCLISSLPEQRSVPFISLILSENQAQHRRELGEMMHSQRLDVSVMNECDVTPKNCNGS